MFRYFWKNEVRRTKKFIDFQKRQRRIVKSFRNLSILIRNVKYFLL